MTNVLPLDRLFGDQRPSLSNVAQVKALETVPFDERIAAHSTYEALQIGAAINPNAIALEFLPNADPDDTARSVNYSEFIGGVTRAANMFHALGIGPGDVVSLLMPLVPQSFMALFGAEASGIANPVNPLLEPAQIASILRAAKTKVIVTVGPTLSVEIWAKIEALRAQLPELKAIVALRWGPDGREGIYDYEKLAAAQPSDHLTSGRTIHSTDVAAYFHTGGTTGMPKLVRQTHRNQVYQAWFMNLMIPTNTLLFGLPLFHVGGALTQGLASLCIGSTLVILSPSGWRNPNAIRNVWRLVERYRPTVFGGVPTVLAAALNVPVGQSDVSSILYCSGGGSAIPVAIGKTYVEKLKMPVLEVYGMTETASVLLMSYPDREQRLGAVGHAGPYSRVRIVQLDADGRYLRDCEVGEIGTMALSGPGAFEGYLESSHNKTAFVEPGWVNSGDLGRIDEDGYVWITGRAKDLIIRGGHNIDPIVVEDVLYQHPAVASVAVVGQPDGYAGELPVAYVQLKPGSSVDSADLIAFVLERTPERAANPVEIYLIDTIPLTGVGKIFKPALRWDAAKRKVLQLLSDVLPSKAKFEVSVHAHDLHGTLVTVNLVEIPLSQRVAVETAVNQQLNPLTLKYEIAWL